MTAAAAARAGPEPGGVSGEMGAMAGPGLAVEAVAAVAVRWAQVVSVGGGVLATGATATATGAASVGTLKVTLRHEPNKSAAGVVGGDITNAGGETDIEVEFPIVIE